MSDYRIPASMPRDGRWTYDDPSGVPETPLAVPVPETLRGGVERAAAREGLTPGEWLVGLITRALTSNNAPKAA